MAKVPKINPLARWVAPLQAAHARLAPREQRAVALAAWVLGLGLLWWLAVAPALDTLRQAPERHARIDAQLSHMRSMAATADSLRAQNTATPLGRDDVLRALEQATAGLAGTAQLAVLGDRATVTLKNTPPDALAQWLSQVRVNARLMPLEAKLSRATEPAAWSGTLVLGGPGLSGS
ncbi:MAG: type II secretion system protein GspM [Hydrogenophaga sp.]|uniref:type II secretion system protein GspM n=1 Tax=Hydrogenophaga sp. TaxID=1904254 RepID=UPI0027322AEB|nr:type II secretion system protein GspM [Hydrogenophaga sp.]MDP2162880.1 type II secretion system protein GspM [Hydrogenophaga sp.]MDP3474396.1 type II secretion system protein GspM [Hydrogenophaga sp.]